MLPIACILVTKVVCSFNNCLLGTNAIKFFEFVGMIVVFNVFLSFVPSMLFASLAAFLIQVTPSRSSHRFLQVSLHSVWSDGVAVRITKKQNKE